MKGKLARDQWWNATETLKEASLLATGGQYKGAISRAFFAMEHAARAALAAKDQEPKTHRGMVQAFNNQLVRSGEMDRDRGESLEDAHQARNAADYGSFYRATADEAYQLCGEAAAFLIETRKYLVNKGLSAADLPEVPEAPARNE